MKCGIRTLVAGVILTYACMPMVANCQDSALEPTYGSRKLKADFTPDPYTIDLEAGGGIKTDKGGVPAFVANAPSFVVDYEAGKYPLTIYAESEADTTLLVRLPDGNFKANNDGPGTGLNPLLRFETPQPGRYTIWVGTVRPGCPNAKLTIFMNMEWSWHGKYERKSKKDKVRGTPCEEYDVQFSQDRLYEIKIRADARKFFPCLRLEYADGPQVGRQVKSASSRDIADDGSADEHTAACMTYFCREKGNFKIIATNYSGVLGTFDLTVREHTPYIYMRELKDVFREIPGRLIKDDPFDSVLRKSPCKTFLFQFKRGITYEIEMRTRRTEERQRVAHFDAVLRLEDDTGQELAFNDDRPRAPDAAGMWPISFNTDSRITFKCPRDLTYRIIATSLSKYYQDTANNPETGYGDFSLIVWKVNKEFTTDDVERFITEVMNTKIQRKYEDQIRQFVYLTPPGYFDITYDRKEEKVSFLGEVYPPPTEANKGNWAEDTANEWNRKSRISQARLLENGGVRLFGAISFADGISLDKLRNAYAQALKEQGEFFISVIRPEAVEVKLTDGKVEKKGTLTKDDPKDPIKIGSPCKVYSVALAKGKRYQIDMTSEAVDSYLHIYDAAGKWIGEDDDAGGDLNARIVFDCGADGTYRIVATSAQGTGVTRGPFGNYTLTLSQKK